MFLIIYKCAWCIDEIYATMGFPVAHFHIQTHLSKNIYQPACPTI
jgi:hypothetical protein